MNPTPSTLTGTDLLDALFPPYDTPCTIHTPNWDEERRFFIHHQSTSQAGHLRYQGVRITDNMVIIEQISHYYTCTYINSIELYVYDGQALKLVSRHDFDKVFYGDQMIRDVTQQMITSYCRSQSKILGRSITDAEIAAYAERLVSNSRRSMLDSDGSHLLSLAQKLLV